MAGAYEVTERARVIALSISAVTATTQTLIQLRAPRTSIGERQGLLSTWAYQSHDPHVKQLFHTSLWVLLGIFVYAARLCSTYASAI